MISIISKTPKLDLEVFRVQLIRVVTPVFCTLLHLPFCRNRDKPNKTKIALMHTLSALVHMTNPESGFYITSQ